MLSHEVAAPANRTLSMVGIPLRLEPVESAPETLSIVSEKGMPLARVPFRLFEDPPSKAEISQLPPGSLVLANRVTPSVADSLRKAGVMYLDLRGNCYFREGSILIDVQGRTQLPDISGSRRSMPTSGRANRKQMPSSALSAFSPRRAQVIATLVSFPELLRLPTRALSAASGTSTGTTIHTLQLLQDQNFLYPVKSGYAFAEDKLDSLLQTWATSYDLGLSTRIELFRGEGDPEVVSRCEVEGFVGGEAATPDLITGGNTACVFLKNPSDVKQIVGRAKLRLEPKGNIVVREAFWTTPDFADERKLTHGAFVGWPEALPILIFGDLFASSDPRLREVSQEVGAMIKETIRAHR